MNTEANQNPRARACEDPIEAVANAVLYEGYLLYPYRLSAVKNHQRWNFGVLYPPNYCQQQRTESAVMQTECLLEGESFTTISVRVRFLQHTTEATLEREVEAQDLSLPRLCELPHVTQFAFGHLSGTLEIAAMKVGDGQFKLTARVANLSNFIGKERDEALYQALISTHKILRLSNGKFHSMIDPPEQLRECKEACCNIRAWPVLIGCEQANDSMLSAPIILYDFPKIAPQSPGNFFDSTEIDELLSLRILTLSDPEKEEMRRGEEQTRILLERTQSLDPEYFLNLHGEMSVSPAKTPLRRGDRVRLRPNRRADIFDLVLAEKSATVISVERDFEDRDYVCVSVDDDPGSDLGSEGKPGHRFFFCLDEVERL